MRHLQSTSNERFGDEKHPGQHRETPFHSADCELASWKLHVSPEHAVVRALSRSGEHGTTAAPLLTLPF